MGKLSDYATAVSVAARTRHVSLWTSLKSVALAKCRYGLGPRLHSLFSLIDTPPELWGEYRIDRELRAKLRQLNPESERGIVNDKLVFFEHCRRHDLPTIPILWAGAYGGPGPKSDRSAWCDAVSREHDKLFFKLVNGAWGQDSFIAEREGGIWRFLNKSGTADALYDYCEKHLSGRRGWLVQPVVKTNVQMHGITSPQALSTIRVVTCMHDDRPVLLFAALKLVVGANITDNFLHGTTGNMVAPVDLETGVLGPARGSTNPGWPGIVPIHNHPQTGIAINGFRVPFWRDAKDVVLRGQLTLPGLKTLGWDLAIADNGPVVVEANANYDGDLLQVALGRGLKNELLGALEKVV